MTKNTPEADSSLLLSSRTPGSPMEMAAMKLLAGMNIQLNRGSGEIITVPQNPGKTIEVLFYSPEGRFLRKLEINHLLRYRFPFELKLPIKYPEQGEWIYIRSIHCLSAAELLLLP